MALKRRSRVCAFRDRLEAERTFCTKEFSRDVEILASNNHNLLTIKQLFSYGTGQATQEMSFAIDNDL